MRCTSTQLADSLVHCSPNDHDCSVPAITVGSVCCRGEGPAATSPTSSEAGYSFGGSGRRTSEEWEAEDDVKGGPLDPREVKNAREKEMKYLWDMEVYEYSTEAEARARTGHVTVRVWCVRVCVIQELNQSSRQHLRRNLCESYSVLHVRKTCFKLRILSRLLPLT